MSFQRYPNYKPSGVEWLGNVPEHWGTPPLYLRYEAVLGKMLDERRLKRTHLLPYVRNIDVQWDRVNVEGLPEFDIAPDEYDRFTLKRGDILICEGGEVGRTAIWRGELEKCAFQKAIHRLRPLDDKENRRFFFHCMSFAASTGVFVAEGNPNTIPHLTGEKLRRYRFPTPPIDEQAKIASFLDRETSKIDGLVAEQRRLMDLLKEKRQAVISYAVTKGLNPHAPMKSSGIEWLGDVPEHWDLRKIRWLFDITKRIAGDLGFDVFSITQQGIRVKDLESNDGQISMDYSKYQLVEVGDFAMNHMDLLTGGVDIAATRGVTSPDYRVVSLQDLSTCHDRFFLYLFQVGYRNKIFYGFGQGSSQLGRWRLPTEQFRDFVFPVPPHREQVQIAEFIQEETDKLDLLTAEAMRAIELLKERRTAIISAAVTGKIDVRKLNNSGPQIDTGGLTTTSANCGIDG